MKIPINLPFLWKVIKSLPNPEFNYVKNMNYLIDDLFNDILTFYLNLDKNKIPITRNKLYRVLNFFWYSDWYDLTQDEQKYLISEGILYPSSPSKEEFISENKDLFDLHAIVDELVDPTFILTKDVNFKIENDKFYFLFNIEKDFPLYYKQMDVILPTGRSIRVNTINLLGKNLKTTEQNLYNYLGHTVYIKEFNDNEDTEIEYRNKIVGLLYLAFNNLLPRILNSTVNMILGLPVSLYENEIIKEIAADYIITNKETYFIDNNIPLADNIKVGAILEKYTPFHNIVKIEYKDKILESNFSIPDYLYTSNDNEMKYINTDYEAPPVFNTNLQFYDLYNKEITNDVIYKNKIKHASYYIYKTYLYNSLFRIKVNINYINISKFNDITLIDEIMPLHTAYVIEGEILAIEDIDLEETINEESSLGIAITPEFEVGNILAIETYTGSLYLGDTQVDISTLPHYELLGQFNSTLIDPIDIFTDIIPYQYFGYLDIPTVLKTNTGMSGDYFIYKEILHVLHLNIVNDEQNISIVFKEKNTLNTVFILNLTFNSGVMTFNFSDFSGGVISGNLNYNDSIQYISLLASYTDETDKFKILIRTKNSIDSYESDLSSYGFSKFDKVINIVNTNTENLTII